MIIKYFFSSSAYLLANKLIQTVLFLLIADRSGLAVFGIWQVLRNAWNNGRLLIDLGIETSIIRQSHLDHETLKSKVETKMTAAIFLFPIITLISILLTSRDYCFLSILIGGSLVADSLACIHLASLRNKLAFHQEGILIVSRSVVSLAFVMLFMRCFPTHTTLILFATMLGQSIHGLWFVGQMFPFKKTFLQKGLQSIREYLNLHLATIFSFLVQRIDLFVFPLFTDFAAIGQYSLAYRLPAELVAFGSNFSGILVSHFSKDAGSEATGRQLIQKLVFWLFGALVVFTFAGLLISRAFPSIQIKNFVLPTLMLTQGMVFGSMVVVLNLATVPFYSFHREKTLIRGYSIGIVLQILGISVFFLGGSVKEYIWIEILSFFLMTIYFLRGRDFSAKREMNPAKISQGSEKFKN